MSKLDLRAMSRTRRLSVEVKQTLFLPCSMGTKKHKSGIVQQVGKRNCSLFWSKIWTSSLRKCQFQILKTNLFHTHPNADELPTDEQKRLKKSSICMIWTKTVELQYIVINIYRARPDKHIEVVGLVSKKILVVLFSGNRVWKEST